VEIELMKKVTVDVAFFEVMAEPRYWEDGEINGKQDEDGEMPLREGDVWHPIIDVKGMIQNWPGVTASIHYKVCDQGEYYLLDADKNRVARWNGSYVPDDYLCPDGDGFGDYIIMTIGPNGQIENWSFNTFDIEQWDAV